MEAIAHSNLPQVSTSNLKLTEDEKYYMQLGEKYTIRQYEELKIKDTNCGFEGIDLARYHIGNCLEHVYQMVGLKKENFPTGELAKRIGKFVCDTFPFIAPDELIKAVEFGLQGKYPAVKKDGSSIFEHYQVMDLTFINEFMQAYVKFRYDKKEIVNYKIEQSKLPPRDQIIEMLKKDDISVKEMIQLAFDKYKADRDDKVDWFRTSWFDWLTYTGFIEYNRDVLNEKFKYMRSRFPRLTPGQCKHRVRVIAIYEAFDSLIDQQSPFEILFENNTYLNIDLLNVLHNTKN
jgi:hypothetical protein